MVLPPPVVVSWELLRLVAGEVGRRAVTWGGGKGCPAVPAGGKPAEVLGDPARGRAEGERG